MKTTKTGIIILAAGNSSRLGRPKQLLQYKGKSLIKRAIDTADAAQLQASVLILGANLELILKEIRNSKMNIAINNNWREGMASGMQKGLEFLEKKLTPDQVILMLCDQPFVDSELLKLLVNKQNESGKGIVACHYNGVFGVPVLFSRKYFEELKSLKASEGAKKVVYAHQDDLAYVEFPNAAIDIDTLEDYERLTNGI
jgi:molybdenum cofactor cytidylyltransferase